MNTHFGKLVLAGGLLLALGGGCVAKEGEETTDLGVTITPIGQVSGDSTVDNSEAPDGKGPSLFELCISTDEGVTGAVWLYAANAKGSQQNWSQWFSASPVAVGQAGEEMCGNLNFMIAQGDTVRINGSFENGQRTLVENKGPLTSSGSSSGSDLIREIWIDDQYYAVGKECVYAENGKKGFDLECEIR